MAARSRESNGGVRHRVTARFTAVAVAALVLIVAGLATAALTWSQTVPGGIAPTASVTSNCPTVSEVASLSAANASAADVVFGCAGSAAFTINSAGSHTPTYVLPGAFSDAFAVPSSASAPTLPACGSFPGAVPLASGGAVNLAAGGFDYCFDSAPGASFASFAISWG